MDHHRPIFWHQGLFLQPQHFQHGDALAEWRHARVADLTDPHLWGVASVSLNDAALTNLQLTVDQLSMLMPDGTMIDFPGNALIAPRTLDLASLADGRTVYVGLRRAVAGQANVRQYDTATDAANADTRYAALADPVAVPDRLSDGPDGQVKMLWYVLRLFLDTEIEHLAQYQLVPIARLDQDGDMARLARAFVPPCLNLSASDTLTQLLRRVRDELMGRSRQLEVFKPVSQGGAQVQEPDASHANLLLALSMLNRYGPLIHHLLETPQVHPWQAYGVLRQLVGELSTFSERYDMLGETRDGRQLIPPYRHDDPGPGFQALASLVSTLLNEIAAAPEMMVRLEPSGPGGDGLYTAELPEGFFGNRHRYYLVVRGDFDPVVMATALPHDAKLAAPDLVETLVTRSLPGVELLHLADPPRGIPRRPGSLYFRVDTLSDAWDGLERAQQAALFLPSTASNLQAELIVTKG